MKPGLSARLARLKKAKNSSPSPPVAGAPPSGAYASDNAERPQERAIPLAGEWREADRDLWIKSRICPSPLRNFRSSGLLLHAYPSQEKWLFYDTETTGLSGGAGNIAFLVGIGRPEGDHFRITQYFLRDYPGEPALLNRLKQDIAGAELFISYNGKSFDRPLLESRFLMNRMPCRMGAQLDLLYPVRSLFRNRMENCRLGTAEQELLGIHRTGDIPGADIPDIWFDFIKEGRHPDMDRVMDHNDQDILSLAVLLKSLEDWLSDPERCPLCDAAALGRFYLDRDDPRAEAWLEKAASGGDQRGEVLFSLYLKRRGEWERAASLWEDILSKRPSLFAALELAKYKEHRQRDYRDALRLTEFLIRALPAGKNKQRNEFIHRHRRLKRKLEKAVAKKDGGELE